MTFSLFDRADIGTSERNGGGGEERTEETLSPLILPPPLPSSSSVFSFSSRFPLILDITGASNLGIKHTQKRKKFLNRGRTCGGFQNLLVVLSVVNSKLLPESFISVLCIYVASSYANHVQTFVSSLLTQPVKRLILLSTSDNLDSNAEENVTSKY